MARAVVWLLALATLTLLQATTTEAKFHEELRITPLAHHGHVALTFKFSIDWDADKSGHHFELCPKSFCSLVASKHISEIDLTMTKGRWNYEKWGNSPLPAPQGAELTVFYDETIDASKIDEAWRATTNGLSGQFCASLEYMYRAPVENITEFSTHPITSFRVQAQTSDEEPNIRLYKESKLKATKPGLLMRHSILHGETVCTENLTPWMKLLPCRSEAGLSRYLSNPSFLFNFDFVSLGVHFGETRQLELTLLLVLDRKLPPVGASISTFQPPRQIDEFLLTRLLGVNVGARHVCPLASSSKLIIDPIATNPPASISTTCPGEAKSSEQFECDLLALKDTPLEVTMNWDAQRAVEKPSMKGFVTAHRWLVGWGQQNGKLALEIENNLARTVSIRYRQVTPFMLRFKFHTMTSHFTSIKTHKTLDLDVSHFSAHPGQDRVSPTSMVLTLDLPARSKVIVTIEYDLVFLHWTEHPPDAHRGFDVSAGVLLVSVDSKALEEMQKKAKEGYLAPVTTSSQGQHHFLIYTEGLVLSLPTPDFSMPYNVITLTSTVITIFFAFSVKTLTRRYRHLFQDGEFKSDRAIVLIWRAISRRLFKKQEAA